MKFIIFFIHIPLVYSAKHYFVTTYTGKNEVGPVIPEFSAETRLDGHQMDYYDSIIKKMIPKQDWMEEYASTELWKDDTEIRKHVQKIYRNNMPVIMQRFDQSDGVHTYQRKYGCKWDDETEESEGFDWYTYDGENFIILVMNEGRYTALVTQAIPTAEKWNNDREQLKVLKRYYDHECVYWMKHFLALQKAGLTRRENLVLLVMCVMGVLTVLFIGIAFIQIKKRVIEYKRVSNQEVTFSDKGL